MNGTRKPTRFLLVGLWLFQLDDDSKTLLGKWLDISISIHLKLGVKRLPGMNDLSPKSFYYAPFSECNIGDHLQPPQKNMASWKIHHL